jgi:hypothetical protein
VIVSLVAIPLLVLLVACGGDKKESPSNSDNGGSSSSGSSGSTGTSGSTGSGSNTGSTSSNDGAFSIENCKQYASLAVAGQAAFGTTSNFKLDQKALDKLVKETPSEIRSDMQVVITAIVDVYTGFEKLGLNLSDPSSFAKLDSAKIAELEKLTAKFDEKKFTDASEKIEKYFATRCS